MNASKPLADCRILVVEDEYFIAQQIASDIIDAGAEVVGPIGTLASALQLLERHARLDAAVLDINLRGERVYPVADVLVERGVPFLFATGYDQAVIPDRFADITRCDKPPSLANLRAMLGL